MTRFTMTNDVTWGSGGSPRSVAIITENQEGFEAYASKAGAALKDSEDLLRNTIKALSKKSFDSDTIEYADCYFLTGKSLSSDVANRISAVLQLSLAGLLGMMGTSALKIKQTDTTAGRVVNKGFSDGSPKESTKPYHNARSRMGNTRVWRAGSIHISGDRLDEGKLGVKTLIHEATHKYAGTVDYCYFDEETPSNKPNKFEHHVKAMQNADSFAWFTLMVGRGNFFSRHFGFNNKM